MTKQAPPPIINNKAVKYQGTPSLKLLVDFGVWFPRWIFWGGFFVDFSGPFSLEKSAGKKSTEKSTKKSSKLFNQNPLREISALSQV